MTNSTKLNIPNEVTLYSRSYSTTCPEAVGARGRNFQLKSIYVYKNCVSVVFKANTNFFNIFF